MSRLVSTVEGEPITEEPDGRVHFVSCARIDTDGSGPLHGDPDAQADTSLHHNGKALNADVVPYIVVPPAIIHGVRGIVLGCQAVVQNQRNGQSSKAVVGDIGPHAKLGEISRALAERIGVDPSPTEGGEESHVISYSLWPGRAAVVDGIQYTLKPS